MTDQSHTKNPRANPDGEIAGGHKFRFATGRDGTIQPMGGMCDCHVFVPIYAWIPNEPGYYPGNGDGSPPPGTPVADARMGARRHLQRGRRIPDGHEGHQGGEEANPGERGEGPALMS